MEEPSTQYIQSSSQRHSKVQTEILRATLEKDALGCKHALQGGAVIDAEVIAYTLKAPSAQTIPTLEVFSDYGWDINDPVSGKHLLYHVLVDASLTMWVLDRCKLPEHGAAEYLLASASRVASVAVFDRLCRQGYPRTNSMIAAASAEEDAGRLPMMEHLRKIGVCVDESDDKGTALYHAVQSCGIEKVKFLLEKGASPSIRNSKGLTPLEEAKFTARHDIVIELSKPR